MSCDKLEKGKSYILTYTKPVYDKHEKKYLPDNFRFVDPYIVPVFYGGRCKESRIEEWYKREDLERRARAGESLAGLVIALEEMKAQEDYFL